MKKMCRFRLLSMFVILLLFVSCTKADQTNNSSLSTNASSEESNFTSDSSDTLSSSVSSLISGNESISSVGNVNSKNNISSKSNTGSKSNSSSSVSSKPIQYKIIKVNFEEFYQKNGNSFFKSMKEALEKANELSLAEKSSGKPYKVVIDVTKRTYKINIPIAVSNVQNIVVNGNGSTVINTSKRACINIDKCQNVEFSNFTFDYDPLPFTQGVITKIEVPTGGKSIITLQVDKGYNSDAESLRAGEAIFNIHDRATKSPAVRSRQFYSVTDIQSPSEGVLKITLGWGINECGAGQVPVVVGDVGVIRSFNGECAINVTNSYGTAFTDFNLYTAPAFGLLENGGEGGMKFTRFNIVPGPKPTGAMQERLSSVNRDATHFICVNNGPVFESCKIMNSGDDAINVQGFYYFVVKKISDNRYYLTPKWDIGMGNGDQVEVLDKNTFTTKATAKIVAFKKILAAGSQLKQTIADQWEGANRSPSVVPNTVYDVTFDKNISLAIGDAATSLDRLGKNTVVNNCTFHGCGRVNVKGPNTTITNNKFTYTLLTAIHVGSDVGYWAESNFANKTMIKNNTFDHCGVSANPLFDGEVNGSIYVSMTAPLVRNEQTFFNNYMNRYVTIENNTINNSYYYGIVLTNADHAVVKNNKINEVFLNSPFRIGYNYALSPEGGILIAQTKNSTITGNTVKSKMYVWEALDIKGICSANNISNNSLK